MREHLWSYAIGAVLLGGTLWMTFAIPRYLAAAIDLMATNPNPQSSPFLGLIAWILVFAVAVVITRTGSRLFFFVPGRRVEFDLKNRLLVHLASLQRGYFVKNPSGAIISRINNDINGVRMLLGAGMMMVITSTGTLSLAPYYMYQLAPRLTLYCAIPIILGFGCMQLGLRRMRSEQVRQMRELRNLSEFTVESFNGVDVLKAYRSYAWAEASFTSISDEVRNAALRMSTVRAYLMPLLLHLTNALKVMVLLVGGAAVIREDLSIGDFTAYMLYLSMLVPPLMGMTFMLFILQRGFTGLTSLLDVFDTKPNLPPVDAAAGARLPPTLSRGLRVQGLSFSYPEAPDLRILCEVSFEVRVGQVVGVFGAVGSGKSTLVNVLNGYLQAPPATVFLDDVDVVALGQGRVREHVVTVAQEPFLFSDSVRENITLALDEISSEGVANAVRVSALAPDLERMPAGIETLVGEKGITLSGGQKQRVALARATLKPCDLLLLDDVLSAVDHETERVLIEQIYLFQHANATLLVSHRISALERADRVLVFEAGRITHQGTHAELVAREGPYREAWRLQASTGKRSASDDGSDGVSQ